jgi:hypothetical protein
LLAGIGLGDASEGARRWRVEVEPVGSNVLDPSFGEQLRQLVGDRHRGGCGRTGTARLGHQADAPTGAQQPGELAEPGGWLWPHRDRVDGKRGVEWTIVDGQALDRRVDQAYSSSLDRGLLRRRA